MSEWEAESDEPGAADDYAFHVEPPEILSDGVILRDDRQEFLDEIS